MPIRYHNINSRAKRRHRSTAESIANSKLTVLINMGIEIIAAVIMAVGLTYIVRYMFHFRHRMVETYFNIFVWAIVIFAVGWGTYIAIKLRGHFLLFRQLKDMEKHPPEES